MTNNQNIEVCWAETGVGFYQTASDLYFLKNNLCSTKAISTTALLFFWSSNQGDTQVRTHKQEAHWLRSQTDPLQSWPTLRQTLLPRQRDFWDGARGTSMRRNHLVHSCHACMSSRSQNGEQMNQNVAHVVETNEGKKFLFIVEFANEVTSQSFFVQIDCLDSSQALEYTINEELWQQGNSNEHSKCGPYDTWLLCDSYIHTQQRENKTNEN